MNTAVQTLVAEVGEYCDTTVIIPTRDEAEGIFGILQLLDQMFPGIALCVVDDRSADGTRAIVREYFQQRKYLERGVTELIERDTGVIHGLTASALDAIMSCGSEYFIVMDSDLQHPPEKLPSLRDALRKGSDLVIGYRVENPTDWPASRRLISFFGSIIARSYLYLLGVSLRDPLSGFFGGRTKLIQKIITSKRHRFEERGYKVLLDLLKLRSEKIVVSEVPYRLQRRTTGHSKFQVRHGYYFVRSLLR